VRVDYATNLPAERMVRAQIRARGITDARLLEVMARLPRHRFAGAGMARSEAYGDFPLPIGHDQTISQPYMVALMTEQLELRGKERVLEIGTGSGYQTAVLAELAREVYTVERIVPLLSRAQALLLRLGYTNIAFREGDGSLGWPEAGPFDRVLVAAAAASIPQPLEAQLADNGLLVIPIGPSEHYQILTVLRRVGGHIEKSESIGCRFVPLVRGPRAY
jgi:protein-L-isoaspartate(D-aspartate) O-methyltransferase